MAKPCACQRLYKCSMRCRGSGAGCVRFPHVPASKGLNHKHSKQEIPARSQNLTGILQVYDQTLIPGWPAVVTVHLGEVLLVSAVCIHDPYVKFDTRIYACPRGLTRSVDDPTIR